jgi:Uma2 family endonuclease
MTTIVQELAEHPELIYRHNVEEYHAMIANGSIMEGEPFELLNGQIVRKIRSASGEDLMTVGIEHALIVKRLSKLSRAFEPFGCHIQSQQPITIPPRDEPEPDAAIVRGTEEDYDERHPQPQDILCIIEVADSSLARDRGYKLQLYANAGIAMYVIVNLIDRVVEVYRDPLQGSGRYAPPEQLTHGQLMLLPTAAGQLVKVPAAQMFVR